MGGPDLQRPGSHAGLKLPRGRQAALPFKIPWVGVIDKECEQGAPGTRETRWLLGSDLSQGHGMCLSVSLPRTAVHLTVVSTVPHVLLSLS